MNIEKYVPEVNPVNPIEILSIPIKIKKTYVDLNQSIDSNIYDSFDLKQNFFDPNKGSPPNNWTNRLIERMEKYYENEKNVSIRHSKQK